MKILTVCEGGNVRSVGLARILKTEHYHNVVAVGTMYAFNSNNGREPGTMLARWADMIVIMSETIVKGSSIPKDQQHKIRICEVGPDVYGNPSHPDLVAKCQDWIKNGMR